jgi:hypothetical protein
LKILVGKAAANLLGRRVPELYDDLATADANTH